jgi:hypothetical protein
LEASEGAKTSTVFLQISAEKSVGVVERKSRSGREFYNAAAEEDGEEQSMPRIRRHFDVVKKTEEKDRHIRA